MTKTIPKDWKQKKLGDLFDFKNGVNAEKSAYGSGIPFINVMEVIFNNSLRAEEIPGKVTLPKKQETENLVNKGDVLFNRTSETKHEIALSSVYLDDVPVVFGGFVIRGRSITDDLTNEFKKYCFRTKHFRRLLIKSGQGAVRSNIGQKDLIKIPFYFPNKVEQTRITSVLGAYDKIIHTLAQKIELNKNIKKGLMQKLLTGKIKLNGFNKDWEIVKLGDVTKPRSERNKALLFERVLSVTNKKGFILPSDYFSKVIASKDLSNYKIAKKHDFAYNPSRINVGSIARLDDYANGILSPMYVIFTLDEKLVDSNFFLEWLFTNRAKASIRDAASGSVRESVDYKSFASIKIKIPELKEQTAIANILNTANNEITNLEKKKQILEDQKKFLLNNLITGEIRTPENITMPNQ